MNTKKLFSHTFHPWSPWQHLSGFNYQSPHVWRLCWELSHSETSSENCLLNRSNILQLSSFNRPEFTYKKLLKIYNNLLMQVRFTFSWIWIAFLGTQMETILSILSTTKYAPQIFILSNRAAFSINLWDFWGGKGQMWIYRLSKKKKKKDVFK